MGVAAGFLQRGTSVSGKMLRMRFDLITVEPGKMNGQPCVRGLRLTVRRLLELIELYPDRAELFREFPELDDADLAQVWASARAQLPDSVSPLAAGKA
jgi:uncharacterized protein (DUF433 family)